MTYTYSVEKRCNNRNTAGLTVLPTGSAQIAI